MSSFPWPPHQHPGEKHFYWPESSLLPTVPRACTIVCTHTEGRGESNSRSAAAALQEEVGRLEADTQESGLHCSGGWTWPCGQWGDTTDLETEGQGQNLWSEGVWTP